MEVAIHSEKSGWNLPPCYANIKEFPYLLLDFHNKFTINALNFEAGIYSCEVILSKLFKQRD